MMSANSQLKRRAVRSEGREPAADGFMQIRHEWVEQAALLCKDRTEILVVLRIMSLANQRNRNGRVDGWTDIVQSDDLAAFAYVQRRMTNIALDRLTEDGVIEQKSVRQALSNNPPLVTREEARGANMFGSILRVNLSEWERLNSEALEQMEAIAEQAAAPAAKESTEASEDEPISITQKPLTLMPGSRPEPLTISADMRNRLRRCDSIEPDCTAAVPVALDLSIVGTKIRISIAEPGAAQRGNIMPRQNVSTINGTKVLTEQQNAPVKKDSDVLVAEDVGMRLAKAGIELDAGLRLSVARALRQVSEEGYGEFVSEVVQTRKDLLQKRKYFKPALSIRLAESFADRWTLRIKAQAAPVHSGPIPDEMKTQEQLLAEYRAKKAARSNS